MRALCGCLVLTPRRYLAPELLQGKSEAGLDRADMFALGATLYELATGSMLPTGEGRDAGGGRGAGGRALGAQRGLAERALWTQGALKVSRTAVCRGGPVPRAARGAAHDDAVRLHQAAAAHQGEKGIKCVGPGRGESGIGTCCLALVGRAARSPWRSPTIRTAPLFLPPPPWLQRLMSADPKDRPSADDVLKSPLLTRLNRHSP